MLELITIKTSVAGVSGAGPKPNEEKAKQLVSLHYGRGVHVVRLQNLHKLELLAHKKYEGIDVYVKRSCEKRGMLAT